jgi:putative ABC transport system permease protein
MTPAPRSGGGPGSSVPARVARMVVRIAAVVVPADRRQEWLGEWLGELGALSEARARGATGLPTPVGFAAGAIPHAMWMRTEGWSVDSVLQDLKYSARVLRRSPGFTTVAALTLALGIGANAAIFSLVNGLVLRHPAQVQQPERLVQIARSYEDAPRWDNFSWPALQTIRAEGRVFAGVAGYSSAAFALGRGVETEQVLGQQVTGNYFEVLGVTPHVGRLIQPSDDVEPGAHAVVVLSHALWERRYGADPEIVGDVVQIGAEPYAVIGVAPEGFTGVETIGSPPALFVPTMQNGGYRGETLFDLWGASWIQVVGRLAEGVSIEEAQAAMSVVSARLREADSVNESIEVLLAEGVGLDPEERQEAGQVSAILAMIVGLVLLLTCTNVANLFLARASARRTEVGVRRAMGAGRGRLVRQLVTESSLLAVLATLLAVPIVMVAGDLLPALFPYRLSVSVGADARVYGFLVGIGLATGLLFGAAPAWAASRRDVAGVLRDGASTGGRTRTRMRDGLVVAQLGLSLGLVAGAALLGRSVLNARSADAGFDPAGLVAGTVDLFSSGRYDESTGTELYRSLLAEAERTPGVVSATLANQMPLVGGHSRATVRPAGREEPAFEAEYVVVGPRYFETLGIPLVRGRALGGLDGEPERVVVVNEALAAMYWPGEDAVGQELDGRGTTWRVVGVAGDVQMRSLRSRGNPAVYYPAAQDYSPLMVLHLRTERGAGIQPAAVRRMVAAVDPQLPVGSVTDLGAALTASMGETRTFGWLVGVFAALALALAAVGLYGLVSYGASQRVREIGIRMALGAEPESLVRLILGRGLAIGVLGVALGMVVAFGLGSALRGLLFGVTHTDPVVLGGAAALLMAAAGLAAWLPARRASRVDAAVSLRES